MTGSSVGIVEPVVEVDVLVETKLVVDVNEVVGAAADDDDVDEEAEPGST